MAAIPPPVSELLSGLPWSLADERLRVRLAFSLERFGYGPGEVPEVAGAGAAVLFLLDGAVAEVLDAGGVTPRQAAVFRQMVGEFAAACAALAGVGVAS